LTASLATRLVPVIGRDADRLADAYALRAARPAESGRFARLRRGAVLTRALAAGAFERAVDLAAALEVRGYAATPRRGKPREWTPWSRHDLAFAASALALAALVLGGAVAGIASFDPYPTLHAEWDVLLAGYAVAIVGLALLPFCVAAVWRARLARVDCGPLSARVLRAGGTRA
jgi:energy-coupling factor transport system permease protein